MSKIIATGNPQDGFKFYGPIQELTDEIAEQYEGDWWVLNLDAIRREFEGGSELLSEPTPEVIINAVFDMFRLAGASQEMVSEVRDALANNWDKLGTEVWS